MGYAQYALESVDGKHICWQDERVKDICNKLQFDIDMQS